jgi:hypothetical protein
MDFAAGQFLVRASRTVGALGLPLGGERRSTNGRPSLPSRGPAPSSALRPAPHSARRATGSISTRQGGTHGASGRVCRHCRAYRRMWALNCGKEVYSFDPAPAASASFPLRCHTRTSSCRPPCTPPSTRALAGASPGPSFVALVRRVSASKSECQCGGYFIRHPEAHPLSPLAHCRGAERGGA